MLEQGDSTNRGWRMWVASLVIMLCSWLSYVDRQTLAVLSPMILRDTGLSITAFSDAVSAFSIAYMIGNPLWGSLLDRIGPEGVTEVIQELLPVTAKVMGMGPPPPVLRRKKVCCWVEGAAMWARKRRRLGARPSFGAGSMA